MTLDDILVLNIKIIHCLENSDQSKMFKEPRDNHKGKYLLLSNERFSELRSSFSGGQFLGKCLRSFGVLSFFVDKLLVNVSLLLVTSRISRVQGRHLERS